MSSGLVLFGAFRSIGQGQSLGLNPAKCNGAAGGGVHWNSHFAGLAAANFRNPKPETPKQGTPTGRPESSRIRLSAFLRIYTGKSPKMRTAGEAARVTSELRGKCFHR